MTIPSYRIASYAGDTMSEELMGQCFELLKHTSSAAYRTSSIGWSPRAKQKEMRESGMQYLVVFSKGTNESNHQVHSSGQESASPADNDVIHGFLSFLLTEDDGVPVIYCYEIHLKEELRGKGIGKELMQRMHQLGKQAGKQKAMLTVFTSNIAAMSFYKRLGYEQFDEEPPPAGGPFRRLRSAVKTFQPSYIIMAKDL